MQLVRRDKPVIGDCEGCADSINVEVWKMHGNMLLCASCRDKELALMTTAPVTPMQAVHVMNEFKKIDQTIPVQADIFNAAMVPFVELKAAILANPAIPDSEKQSTYVHQLNEHIVNLKRVLFETQTSLRACQTIGQSAAMELHESERAKYSEFSLDYKRDKPVKPATIKKAASPRTRSAAPAGPSPKANAMAALEAAKAYPGMNSAHVLMYMQAYKCDAPKAAKLVSESGLYTTN